MTKPNDLQATPRTDDAATSCLLYYGAKGFVNDSFSRQLERELAQKTAEVEALKHEIYAYKTSDKFQLTDKMLDAAEQKQLAQAEENAQLKQELAQANVWSTELRDESVLQDYQIEQLKQEVGRLQKALQGMLDAFAARNPAIGEPPVIIAARACLAKPPTPKAE